MGAKTKDILAQFLVEAVTLSVLGGVIGIVLGSAASLLISHFAGWSTLISTPAVALAFVFSGAGRDLLRLLPGAQSGVPRPHRRPPLRVTKVAFVTLRMWMVL